MAGCSSTLGFPTRKYSFSHFILSLLSPQLVLPAPEPESVISPRSRVLLAAGGGRNQDLGAGVLTAPAMSQLLGLLSRQSQRAGRLLRHHRHCGVSVLLGRVPFTPVSRHNITPAEPQARLGGEVIGLLTQASGTKQLNGQLHTLSAQRTESRTLKIC